MIDKVYSWDLNKFIETINALVEESNIHERQIDELQMKLEPQKCEPIEPVHKAVRSTNEKLRNKLEIALDALDKIDKQLTTKIEMTWQARVALEKIKELDNNGQKDE